MIEITKVDPRNLPDSLREPGGIRCGYIPSDLTYTVPGLGSPNAPESSSVYVFDISNPQNPDRREIVKTGPLVGQREDGVDIYSGSHPNAVVVGRDAIYVANGNNDSISVLNPQTYQERGRIALTPLNGQDRTLRGVQPVGLALSPDGAFLYVAEAGINALGVVRLNGGGLLGRVIGHIPTGWWPSSVRVSADGKSLYVANARGHGAGPNPVGESNSPKFSVLGTVSIIPTPAGSQLDAYTTRVYANNGFSAANRITREEGSPIPSQGGTPSSRIKHVIFINKENATHDLLLGDITQTRGGVAVNGQPGLLARVRRESESPRTGVALRLQRQLLPGAVRFVRRPPLVDWSVHDRKRRNPLAGLVRRQACRTRATIRPSSRTFRAASDSRTPTHRRSRMTSTSRAGSCCT